MKNDSKGIRLTKYSCYRVGIYFVSSFVCQLCGVRCTTRNNCVRHILHKHPGIPHQEANNIITFCGNGPNDLDMDIDAMTTDGTEDSSDVDISRGNHVGTIKDNKNLIAWYIDYFSYYL